MSKYKPFLITFAIAVLAIAVVFRIGALRNKVANVA